MRCLFLLLTLILTANPSGFAESLFQPNDCLLICGDSITEQKLYSSLIEDYLLMCRPIAGLRVSQAGWSREQANGMLAKLETDIFPFKPTIVTMNDGMNDGLYQPIDEAVANNYRQMQTSIVQGLKKAGVRVVVIGSPKCIDTFSFHNCSAEEYNKTLGNFAKIDREIAEKEGVVYAPVYEETLAAMTKVKAEKGAEYDAMGPDGIHPKANGALVMAYAYLKALGCDGAIGTLTVDFAGKHAEGTPGNKVVSFQDGTLTVESTRYPFCFTGDPSSKESGTYDTAGIVNSMPFNQDLNRYLLVVKGLSTASAKVTWGDASKEFSTADLAKGINLAAEFPTTPFADQFKQVHDAVFRQQEYETFLVKRCMHWVDSLKAMDAAEPEAVDQLITSGIEQDYAVHQSAAMKLVIPVQHTIKIEPISNH